MLATRLLPILAVIAALLLPAPALAQDAEVVIPVAVVAQDGSWQASGDGTGCELVWDRAGTPTLRVHGSGGDRVREDLVGGEQMALPEAGPGTSCVFEIEVSTVGSRRYEFSLEGAELATVDAADIEALAGTLVLPVVLGDEGDYALATDTYLDLPLADTADRPPVSIPATDEGGLASPTPAGTPVSADIAGQVVDVVVELFVPEAMSVRTDGGCRISAGDDAAVLRLEASTGRYRSELSLRTDGVPVTVQESPTGAAGCLFTFPLHLPAADVYTFHYGDATLAEVRFTDMLDWTEPYLITVGTPERATPIATPLS